MTGGGFNISEFIGRIFHAGAQTRAPETKPPEDSEIVCLPPPADANTDMECFERGTIDSYITKAKSLKESIVKKTCEGLAQNPPTLCGSLIGLFMISAECNGSNEI